MLDDITMQNFNESSIDSEPLAKKWKELRQFEERVDDDLVVDRARTKVSDRCPITLVPFTDPVKSKKCGHTYEREAILKVLSSVQKCPVCQKKLTANQLVDDLELFQKIQNQKRIAMRAKKSGFISSSCNSRTMDLTQSN
jgi:SUMO ligase MMS21 Smc5/6 complex component